MYICKSAFAYVYIYIYTYLSLSLSNSLSLSLSTEKIGTWTGVFGWPRGASAGPRGPDPCPRAGLGPYSGFGPLFVLIKSQDRQHRPQERPKTANIRPESGPRPPS